jgi:gas vesicle protein GvpK
MDPAGTARVESETIRDFALVMQQDDKIQPRVPHAGIPGRARLDLDPDRLKNGLGQLVLTVVKLLHELLERQALRRIDAGSLAPEQIEKLGLTLMGQAEEIERLRREFGLEAQDLDLDLGPLGRLF